MNSQTQQLLSRKSKALTKGTPALNSEQVSELLKAIPGWAINAKGEIARTFNFNDFHGTMAFVNKVADIANAEDHHPDMEVSYNKCTVKFSTHSVGGLSENDFMCAAKASAAYAPRSS